MTKPSIDTLVEDINNVLTTGVELTDEQAAEFGRTMAFTIQEKLTPRTQGGTLRMSNLGKPCERQLWYDVNCPELAEELPPATRFKFLFGDVIEALTLFLAKVAGHEVEGEQDEVEVEGVLGHRDARIDGELVDVKSASKYSFNKFVQGLVPDSDAFGYLTQLKGYLFASKDVRPDRAHFLVIGKELGNITLDTHEIDTRGFDEEVRRKKAIVESSEVPPRGFSPEPDGKSGNLKLGVNCSYCSFRHTCYPNLRTFIYASGPRYLTTVVRTPDVPEVIV